MTRAGTKAVGVRALVLTERALAMPHVTGAPRVSHTETELLREIPVIDEHGKGGTLFMPIERPLRIHLDGREVVTLMTLGAAPEYLVLGYLRNQRLIVAVQDLESVEVDLNQGVARVATRAAAPCAAAPARPDVACALGTGFADAMSPAADVLPRMTGGSVGHEDLLAVLESARAHDDVHRAAGSVHSCALFEGKELLLTVEDVSRHNGVDTVTGWMALHGVAGADKILFTTGRLTAEMVMKAAFNGVAVMVSRNGSTAMGYDLAARLGMTLIGRAANKRYTCYIGWDRLRT
jgi:FdhD protein